MSSKVIHLKDPHHLVSKPWIFKIGYLYSYIYFLNFRFKKIRRMIVFSFLNSKITKKKRNFFLQVFCFPSIFFVVIFVFGFHFLVFLKFSISFSFSFFFCDQPIFNLEKINRDVAVRSFIKKKNVLIRVSTLNCYKF